MIINTSVCIEASKSETWKYLSDLEGASAWVEDLVSTKLDDPESRGEGTIRICEMKNGKKARERITDWLEGSAFTYNVIEAPMMKAATNSWAIEAVDGKSLVTSKAVIQFKGSFLGGILGFIMQPLIYRSMQKYLAAFKYLVENGRPYEGNPKALGKIPFTC